MAKTALYRLLLVLEAATGFITMIQILRDVINAARTLLRRRRPIPVPVRVRVRCASPSLTPGGRIRW